MSLKDAEEVSTKSDFDDETTHVLGSMVESSKKKELKKFNFVTKSGEHVHLTKEHISAQKKIEEEAKAEVAKREGEMRKEELIDLFGLEVVNKLHQGPGLDDHARTFSSLLLAEIDKINLNPLKQMRIIEQLRQ
ncbi:hypothetical protein Tco_0256245 [Tanacetum coccineum]